MRRPLTAIARSLGEVFQARIGAHAERGDVDEQRRLVALGNRACARFGSALFLAPVFTARQQVGNSPATSERERPAILTLVATLPPLYAHRLGRDSGPDSSRSALQATLAGPVDGLETDACLTADGRLALLHDPWLSTGTTLRGWAHRTAWSDFRHARLRDRDGAPTNETPMLLDELLDDAPGHLTVQVEVKAHGDPGLARATAAAVCRVAGARPDRGRVEVLSFHTAACEEAVRHGMPARLVAWADYAPAALGRWAGLAGVRGVCIEHFLLHPGLVDRLRSDGLSVTTGTVNDAALAARAAALGVDAITTDRPAALHCALAATSLAA
jgi:glycerophosphoryl diester phosphodiesterase